jgi:hypothetical protein
MQALRRWFVRLPRTNFRKIPKPFLLSTRHLRGDAARLPRTHFRKIPKIFLAVHEGSPRSNMLPILSVPAACKSICSSVTPFPHAAWPYRDL